MKIYYAHAIVIYGTEHERTEREQIKKKFLKSKIVDPSSYENKKKKYIMGMKFCLQLVESCDVLVFTKLLGKITSGVGVEINHALSKSIPVFELKVGKFCRIKNKVKYISRGQTISLYNKWKEKYLYERWDNFINFSNCMPITSCYTS